MVLGVVAVLLAAEVGARTISPHLEPVADWPRTDYVQHEELLVDRAEDLELLILGSSVVGTALAPDAMERAGGPGPGYNYWLAGPPMRSISLLATEVLLDRTTPSVVIIGVTMREFNRGASQQSHLNALRASYSFQAASGRLGWAAVLDHGLQSASHLARHRLAFRDPARFVRELRAPALVAEEIEADGYLADRGDNRLADEPPSHLAQERLAMANYTLDESDLDALHDLLAHLRDRNISALVVNLPVTEQFIEMAEGGRTDYAEYLTTIESISRTHDAGWLDTMAAASWPDRYFGDVNHLNDRGAAALQPIVLEALLRQRPDAADG